MTLEMSTFGSLCLLTSMYWSPDGVSIHKRGFFYGWTLLTFVSTAIILKQPLIIKLTEMSCKSWVLGNFLILNLMPFLADSSCFECIWRYSGGISDAIFWWYQEGTCYIYLVLSAAQLKIKVTAHQTKQILYITWHRQTCKLLFMAMKPIVVFYTGQSTVSIQLSSSFHTILRYIYIYIHTHILFQIRI